MKFNPLIFVILFFLFFPAAIGYAILCYFANEE